MNRLCASNESASQTKSFTSVVQEYETRWEWGLSCPLRFAWEHCWYRHLCFLVLVNLQWERYGHNAW
jgi:hypothetical protein